MPASQEHSQEHADELVRAAARSASESALGYIDHLMRRYDQMVERLRRGDDSVALDELAASTTSLNDFLTYLVLSSECVKEAQPELYVSLLSYRRDLMRVIESLNPALGDLDLVEVADTIEQDLSPQLRAYDDLHENLQQALAA